jgi:phenylacetate-CoA ligase
MFDSAIDQLRYVYSVLANKPLRPAVLHRIGRDLGATLEEFGTPGDDVELLPGQHGGADAGVTAAMRSRSLRATARWAESTPYYRQVFADTGLRSAELGLDTWARLPVTPKQALKAMPAAFVSSRVNPVVQGRTTGTTGVPACVWFSREEHESIVAMSVIGATLQQGLRRHHVVAFAGCSRATMPVTVSMETTVRIGASYIQLGTVEPEVVLDALASPVGLRDKAPQVTHLTCATSVLAGLVQAAQDGGWHPDDFGLESITVGGEVLTAALRQRALRTLGALPSSGYLLTEALPYGAGLCRQGHLHFSGETAYVEFLDPRSHEPAAPGALATIVITPLYPYRRCTMLLRYVTGDLVRTLAGKPDCELAQLPATSDILGRYSGPASLVVLTRPLLEVLEMHAEIPLPCRYAIVGEERPVLHVWSRTDEPWLRAALLDEFIAHGVPIGDVRLYRVRADLPPTAPVRADLREHSFEASHLAPQLAEGVG